MKTLIQEGVEVLQDLTIDVINRVIDHNAKGYDLLRSDPSDLEVEEHHSILIDIIKAIKPAFKIAREFIGTEHPHLLNILNWIEKVYDSIVGNLVTA